MAKRKSNNVALLNGYSAGHKKNIYTTIDGWQVEFGTVSQDYLERVKLAIEKRYRDAGEPLDPPMYEIEVMGGKTREQPHNETTLETEEDKAIYAAHKDAVDRLENEQSAITAKILLVDGTISATSPRGTKIDLTFDENDEWAPPARWLKRQERMDLELSDDPEDLKLDYLTLEILKTPDDQSGIISEIITLSLSGGLSDEGVKLIKNSFRSEMERNQATATASLKVAIGRDSSEE